MIFRSVDGSPLVSEGAKHLDGTAKRDKDALGENVIDDAHFALVWGAAGHEAHREIARAQSSPSRRTSGDEDHLGQGVPSVYPCAKST